MFFVHSNESNPSFLFICLTNCTACFVASIQIFCMRDCTYLIQSIAFDKIYRKWKRKKAKQTTHIVQSNCVSAVQLRLIVLCSNILCDSSFWFIESLFYVWIEWKCFRKTRIPKTIDIIIIDLVDTFFGHILSHCLIPADGYALLLVVVLMVLACEKSLLLRSLDKAAFSWSRTKSFNKQTVEICTKTYQRNPKNRKKKQKDNTKTRDREKTRRTNKKKKKTKQKIPVGQKMGIYYRNVVAVGYAANMNGFSFASLRGSLCSNT